MGVLYLRANSTNTGRVAKLTFFSRPQEGKVIISFTGPSGIGKGYVKDQICLAIPEIKELVWLTTRPLRNGEKNRLHTPLNEFNAMERDGLLVLVQDLYNHRYALLRSDLEPCESIRITELHCLNMKKALRLNRKILSIGFITDSLDFLRQRMRLRHTENEEEIAARVKDAVNEIAVIKQNTHLFAAIFKVNHANESEIAAEVLRLIYKHICRTRIL